MLSRIFLFSGFIVYIFGLYFLRFEIGAIRFLFKGLSSKNFV